MQAGELDQRVTLKHKALSGDGSGGTLKSPTVYADVWAKVQPIRGAERDKAQATEAISGYVVTIRTRSDVLEGDTIVWGTRSMNVRFVRDAGVRKAFMEIEADKGASTGG